MPLNSGSITRMDKLHVNRLSFYGYHGALPEERVLGQHYVTSLVLELDASTAGRSDALDQTIDYREAIAIVREVIAGPPVNLIETLAERIADGLLQALPLAAAVSVSITKPHPPVGADLDDVTLVIRRERAAEA